MERDVQQARNDSEAGDVLDDPDAVPRDQRLQQSDRGGHQQAHDQECPNPHLAIINLHAPLVCPRLIKGGKVQKAV
jgi:hypothetical protein